LLFCRNCCDRGKVIIIQNIDNINGLVVLSSRPAKAAATNTLTNWARWKAQPKQCVQKLDSGKRIVTRDDLTGCSPTSKRVGPRRIGVLIAIMVTPLIATIGSDNLSRSTFKISSRQTQNDKREGL